MFALGSQKLDVVSTVSRNLNCFTALGESIGIAPLSPPPPPPSLPRLRNDPRAMIFYQKYTHCYIMLILHNMSQFGVLIQYVKENLASFDVRRPVRTASQRRFQSLKARLTNYQSEAGIKTIGSTNC